MLENFLCVVNTYKTSEKEDTLDHHAPGKLVYYVFCDLNTVKHEANLTSVFKLLHNKKQYGGLLGESVTEAMNSGSLKNLLFQEELYKTG